MFRLLRYFSLTSLISIAIAAAVLNLLYRRNALDNLVVMGEANNRALTQTLANSLRPKLNSYLAVAQTLPTAQLREHPQREAFQAAIVGHLQGLSVVKVKVYDLQGRTLFSTEAKQIGDDKSGNLGFQGARDGIVRSELVHRHRFSAFEQEIADRDLLSTYIPVRSASGGGVEAVFEVYDDVTPFLVFINQTQRLAVFWVVGIFGLLYAFLFLIVRHADGVIRNQYHEREAAEEALRLWQATLEQRVEERTLALASANLGLEAEMAERKLTEERLRQSEKMQAVGQLAGGVAHDFNNQLTPILGYSEMLLNRLDDPVLQKYASHIRTAATRAADLTNQLLAFSRKGNYISVTVDIHKVIAEVIALLEHSLDKRIEIRQQLEANPHTVLGDPTQIQNALLNLAVNARDAMPGGGKLTFTTSVVEQQADPADPESLAGRYLEVCVVDTGTGMTAETQRHLFEPFFTTKPVGEGTGLGLAAVHGAVKNHHGRVRVESQLGVGSTFAVRLPLLENAEAGPEGEPAPATVQGQARILLVDDEDLVRQIASDLLRSFGYKVTTCENGEEAVGYYRQSWEHIDLVILDMVMPRMGGRETFTAMRNINPKIKAILVSGHSLGGEAQQVLDEGGLAWVQKPFNRTQLSRQVAEALRRG
ncbi:MAG: response regulator [Geothrix sp.]|uniref:hybrid sensor histidine kinase/response regulator n=1 Tax=Geothrix sp. TaxID=1962974 RepID=UPI003BAEF717